MDGGRDGDGDGDEAKVSKIFQAILDPRIVLAAEAPRRSRGARLSEGIASGRRKR